MNILNDSGWQLIINVTVALLAGIAGVITSIVIFQKQRNLKSISYEIISDTPVLGVAGEVKDKVEIRFAGKIVENVRLIILRVWNSGNVPIVPSDYFEPITFEFGKKEEVLNIDILQTTPADLNPLLKMNINKFILEPLLLNRKDVITVKILLTGEEGKISVGTRIIGIEKIVETNSNQQPYFNYPRIVIIASVSLTIVGLSVVWMLSILQIVPSIIGEAIPVLLSVLTSVFTILLFIIIALNSIKKTNITS